MPRIALRWPRRVRGSLPQHPRSTQAPHRIAETRVRTRPAQPVDATRIRVRLLVPAGVRAILNAGWPTLLAALSFLLTTNLSGPLFDGILSALRALACGAGCLALPTPRGRFLTPFAKVAFPPHTVTALDGLPQAQHAPRSPVSLEGLTLGLADSGRESGSGTGPGLRNLACFRVLVTATMFLAGPLGPSQFSVLEALHNTDCVLTIRGTATAWFSVLGSQRRCDFWYVKQVR